MAQLPDSVHATCSSNYGVRHFQLGKGLAACVCVCKYIGGERERKKERKKERETMTDV